MTDLKLLEHQELYHGRVFDLIVDHVQYPSGNTSVREIARHPGGAVVVPILPGDLVLFVKQFRYPIGREIIELPAGKLSPREDPAEAARRELEEETGWTADSFEKLAGVYSTPGFCDELLHIYVAKGMRRLPGGPRREEGEAGMTLLEFPFEEALAMVDRGEIEDAKSVAGLLMAARKRTAGGR